MKIFTGMILSLDRFENTGLNLLTLLYPVLWLVVLMVFGAVD